MAHSIIFLRADRPHKMQAHRHPQAPILFPTEGSYWVLTDQGNWLVPPGQAVWIPPDIEHEVMAHDSVKVLLLFIDDAYTDPLPAQCVAVSVSPLLRELFKQAVEYGNDSAVKRPEARLVSVMLDELNAMEPMPFFCPCPPMPGFPGS